MVNTFDLHWSFVCDVFVRTFNYVKNKIFHIWSFRSRVCLHCVTWAPGVQHGKSGCRRIWHDSDGNVPPKTARRERGRAWLKQLCVTSSTRSKLHTTPAALNYYTTHQNNIMELKVTQHCSKTLLHAQRCNLLQSAAVMSGLMSLLRSPTKTETRNLASWRQTLQYNDVRADRCMIHV